MNWRHALAALALVATVPARAQTQGQSPSASSALFTGLEVADVARAEAFYTAALGMKRVMRLSRPSDPFVKDALTFSGDPLAGEPLLILIHHIGPDARPPAQGVTLGFRVADAQAAARRVRDAGYAVLRDPPAVPESGRAVALVRDPDGNVVELVQLVLPAVPGGKGN